MPMPCGTKGDKAAGAAKYRGIFDDHKVHFLKEENRPRLYGRLIDFDVDRGNTVSAKRVLAEATNKKVTPMVEHPEAKALVAAEQARLSREQAAAKGEVLTADFYPFKKGTIQRTMHAVYWSTGETNSTREYAHDGEGTITMRLIEHFATPGNANLPLGKPKQLLHREKDGYVEIGEKQELLKRTDWHPVVKIGAVEGEEWERQFGPTITEKYKVTKFGPEELALKGDGSKKKLAVATVEKLLIATLDGGKKMEMGEEIKLGKCVGPISRRSWRIENEKRERNWSEFIVPVVKK